MSGKPIGKRRKRKAPSLDSDEHTPLNGNNHPQHSIPNRASAPPPTAPLFDNHYQTQCQGLNGNCIAYPLSFAAGSQWYLTNVIRDQAFVIATFYADLATVLDAWQASLASNGNTLGPHELVGRLINANYFTRYMANLHPMTDRNGQTSYQNPLAQQIPLPMAFDNYSGQGAPQPMYYNYTPPGQPYSAASAMPQRQNARTHVEMNVIDNPSLDGARTAAANSSTLQDQKDQVKMMDAEPPRPKNESMAYTKPNQGHPVPNPASIELMVQCVAASLTGIRGNKKASKKGANADGPL